jgi:hypothetical protein
MDENQSASCTAFEGNRRIASGDLRQVAQKAKEVMDREGHAPVLIFDDATSEPVEVDFRGTVSEVLARLGGTARRPGRPKLGVVAREVTLLPRHWEWLNSQPGGASVALRKLVEEARRANAGRDRVRQSQEAAYRFLSAMAGNEPGFEEAIRALFAGDRARFEGFVDAWPADIRDHAKMLAGAAFTPPA